MSFRSRPLIVLALVAAGLLPAAAAAQEPGKPLWRVAGFATLGAAYHDGDGLRFRRDAGQAGGVRGNRIGMGVDSRIGLQLTGVFSPRWSAMAQLVSRHNAEGKWTPRLSWAYVRYALKDRVELRLGRMVSDLYLEGDSRDVGYAYTTVRPNPEVFGLLAADTYDGAELSLRRMVGGGHLRLKFYGGRSRGDAYYYETTDKLPRSRTLGTTLEWEGRNLVMRASWGEVLNYDKDKFRPLANGLAALGSAVGDRDMLRRAQSMVGDMRIEYAALGAKYERDDLSLQAIGARMRYSAFPGYRGWSSAVTAAYRIGNWKPYLIWSRSVFDARSAPLDFAAAAAALGPGAGAQVGALQSAYQGAAQYLQQDQRSAGIGVRYDFAAPVALKFQVDHVRAKSSTLLLAEGGGPVRNRNLTVFSVVMDAVF